MPNAESLHPSGAVREVRSDIGGFKTFLLRGNVG
jgi:hypothetical protein